MKPYRERTTNDFCEHWYYSQASYKGDHELLGYQPCEEGEGRDVNNDNTVNKQITYLLTFLIPVELQVPVGVFFSRYES